MKEYDIFIPLLYNNGDAIELTKIRTLQDLLLETFGGLTVFPQPNQGFWKMGEVTYQDEIIILRVVTPRVKFARRFFKKLKEELKRSLRQEEILIIERDVNAM